MLAALNTANLLLDRLRPLAVKGAPLAPAAPEQNILSAARKSSSIFSADHFDRNSMKVRLMERLGRAFGLNLNDFANAGDMARVIRQEMAKLTPEGISAIEKRVGLDKLSVSLNEMLDAMSNPGGGADKKLDAALRNGVAAASQRDEEQDQRRRELGLDEIGRYSFHLSMRKTDR